MFKNNRPVLGGYCYKISHKLGHRQPLLARDVIANGHNHYFPIATAAHAGQRTDRGDDFFIEFVFDHTTYQDLGQKIQISRAFVPTWARTPAP